MKGRQSHGNNVISFNETIVALVIPHYFIYALILHCKNFIGKTVGHLFKHIKKPSLAKLIVSHSYRYLIINVIFSSPKTKYQYKSALIITLILLMCLEILRRMSMIPTRKFSSVICISWPSL
ncbi:uncharacterized protein EV154DRAFT_479652 [Mucor mucedo]|uniref:uncharacterized protein n=1 Tax=Mucor mucedo TaxID=29922 RepID=UPI00221FCB18|nr:uncharacterized protein EV154DRAFT_479652 [Mucor mucedo]KAI7893212.1 hypothetical protein EV154DRAFT_479652 [Mucor mucedo]